MRSVRPTLLLVAVLLGATVAACGDDDTAPPPSTAPAPTTAVVATTSAAPVTAAPGTSTAPSTSPPAPTTTGIATTTTTTVTTTTEPGPVSIELVVSAGTVEGPERVTVSRGDEVRLTVAADVADEVHVHGYDYKADVAPSAPAVITFVADLPGIYEVELEHAGLVLVELEVR